MRQTTDVLIVGAGPTGLSLAYQLRRLGVRFRIIDKNPAPSTTSKAIGLQYRVSEVLTWMGLFERFRPYGLVSTGINFYVDHKKILNLTIGRLRGKSGAGAFEPTGLLIPQSETEALLIEALREREVEIERGTAFISFTQDRDRVISQIQRADGAEDLVESRYLVSCEGAHSIIRKQAGISFEGKTYPLAFFMADVALDWEAPHDQISVWLNEDGMFSAMPLPGDRRWRLFVEVGQQADAGETEVTLDLVRRLMAERTGDHVTQASDPRWLSEFRISCRMVDRFSDGRVFLAGDAAHIHSPTGGQGITTGMQDIYNLAWKLAMVLQGTAPESLLETYSAERMPIAQQVLKSTDQNTNVFMAHSRAGRLLRDRVVLPLLRRRVVQQWLARRTSQLDLNYRDYGLSSHQERARFGRARVRAGDRTPDVLFQQAGSGAQTSLFEQLTRSRLIALIGPGRAQPQRIEQLVAALERLGIDCSVVLPKGAEAPRDDRYLIDVSGDFGRLYGARGEFLYLVRPDGYVGLFQRPIDERALRGYLAQLFTPEALERAFAAPELGAPVGVGR
jgi:2-polyprenyl-6-methoxyphenol hydroxylase-like FAD-dependent oxidoreductase